MLLRTSPMIARMTLRRNGGETKRKIGLQSGLNLFFALLCAYIKGAGLDRLWR